MRHSSLDLSAQGFRIELPFPPLLESWERGDHPAQVKLAAYGEAIAALAAPALARLERPLALGFHVAGRADIAAGGDLDNFLTPVVKALGGRQASRAFAFVWATRGLTGETPALTLMQAADARLDMAGNRGRRGRGSQFRRQVVPGRRRLRPQ